jgi:hypothetical protein
LMLHTQIAASHIFSNLLFYFSIFHLLATKSLPTTIALQNQFFPPSAVSYTTLTHIVFSTNVVFNLFCSLDYFHHKLWNIINACL